MTASESEDDQNPKISFWHFVTPDFDPLKTCRFCHVLFPQKMVGGASPCGRSCLAIGTACSWLPARPAGLGNRLPWGGIANAGTPRTRSGSCSISTCELCDPEGTLESNRIESSQKLSQKKWWELSFWTPFYPSYESGNQWWASQDS